MSCDGDEFTSARLSATGDHRFSAIPLRTVSVGKLAALTYFSVAGGAFGIEDSVHGGPAYPLLGFIIIPLLWSFPIAMMTAELSTALPDNFGYISWVHIAFGDFIAWVNSVCRFLYNCVELALYPVLFVDYIPNFDPPRWQKIVIMCSMIIVMMALNIRGLEVVGLLSVVLFFLTTVPYMLLIGFGMPDVDPSLWLETTGSLDFSLLLSVVMWNCSGYEGVGCVAGEVVNPGSAYPRSLFIAVFLMTLTYVLPLAVGVCVDRDWKNWQDGHFVQVGDEIGQWLGFSIAFAALLANFSQCTVLLATTSRALHAMSELAIIPRVITHVHDKWRTPWVAIVVNSVVMTAFACIFSFQTLVKMNVFLYSLSIFFISLSFLRLKYTMPEINRPFTVPFGIVGAIAAAVPVIGLCMASVAFNDWESFAVGGGVVAFCCIVSFVKYLASGKKPKPELYQPLAPTGNENQS